MILGNSLPMVFVYESMGVPKVTSRPSQKQPWREEELLARLLLEGLPLAQVGLKIVRTAPALLSVGRPDGIVELSWHGRTQEYVCEYRARSTPKVVENAVASVKRYSAESGLPALIIVPYLSEERLMALERENVSGADLSGNGVLRFGESVLWRSGRPNLYRESQSIRNVYRGSSSIFARCFLLRAEYPSLSSLCEFALSRFDMGGTRATEDEPKLTLGTASKVVDQLQEELIVRKSGRSLAVIDADRLLENLRVNYAPRAALRREGKTDKTPQGVWANLGLSSPDSPIDNANASRYVATGLGSAAKYRVLSGPDKLSLYVSDLDAAAEVVGMRETRAFPNIELIESKDDLTYFDARRQGNEVWASPIQTWLELATGGPREREAAQSLRVALAQGRGEELS